MKTEKFELKALRLRKYLKEKGVELSDDDSINTIAFLEGYASWSAMEEKLNK